MISPMSLGRSWCCRITLALCSILSVVQAQPPLPPKGYFQFPFMPGKPASLTGNMGELRSNHFHGGLDVRTNYVEGLPIVAAADGYVSYVIQDSHGYGNMIVLTHPNGYRTAYAHLQSYAPAVQAYVRAKQYELEQFRVELTPPAGMFTFKKGEQIGLGGNSGHSAGPHLHFEIRDSLGGVYNPLLLEFPEVRDKLAPYFASMGIRPLEPNARVEGKFQRKELKVVKDGKDYYVNGAVEVWGTVGLEAMVHDRINNGTHRGAVTCLDIKVDGKEVYYHNMSHLPLDEARQINNHLVYDHYVRSGAKFQKCYIADGNVLAKYRASGKNGRILINEERDYQVLIHISDAAGNSAELHMKIRGRKPQVPSAAATAGGAKAKFRHELEENTLLISASNLPNETKAISIFTKGLQHTCPLAYNDETKGVFIWDMRRGLPDSIVAPNGSEVTHFKAVAPSKKSTDYKGQMLSLNISEEVLFDTLYLEIKEDAEEQTVQVSNGFTPLHSALTLALKPAQLPANPDKVGAAQVISKDRLKFAGGSWTSDGYLKFKTKYLGKYTLVEDTKPPTIRKVVANGKNIRFTIGDNMAGVHSWRATLNGKFLLFCYEHKRNIIWAEPKTPGESLSGQLVLEVKDMLGNVAKWEGDIP